MHHRTDIQVVTDIRADLGEAPCWDARTGTLLFVDVTAGRVHRLNPLDGSLGSFDVGQEVSAVIPRTAGGLVLAVRDGIAVCDDDGTAPALTVPIEADNPANRMNDAKCDPRGRLLAGTMAFDATAGAGALYQVAPGHSVHPVVRGTSISNGLGWSPDGTRMYYIDSATGGVDVFDYDADTGALASRRRLITVPEGGGSPDGMAVDAEGCLWVALWGAGRVCRYTPFGEPAGEIALPASQVTSVAFGGPDLTKLFITSAAYRLNAEQRARQPLAGAVFLADPGVAGLPTQAFAG